MFSWPQLRKKVLIAQCPVPNAPAQCSSAQRPRPHLPVRAEPGRMTVVRSIHPSQVVGSGLGVSRVQSPLVLLPFQLCTRRTRCRPCTAPRLGNWPDWQTGYLGATTLVGDQRCAPATVPYSRKDLLCAVEVLYVPTDTRCRVLLWYSTYRTPKNYPGRNYYN